MRNVLRRTVCSLVFFCAMVGMPSAGEASPAGDALRVKLARVMATRSTSVPELGGVIDSLAAYGSLASACLEDLPDLKPGERAEFKRLLVDLTRVSLRRQLGRLRGAEVKWGVEMRDGNNNYVAKSVVKTGDGSIDVDWVVVREGEDWRLGDVVTEGASMVKTWRRSFKAAYAKGGWSALSKKLRTAAERAEAAHGG